MSKQRTQFAFLFHARFSFRHDVGLMWPPLRYVPERWYEKLTNEVALPPVPFSKLYLSDRPAEPLGFVFMLPLLGRQMLSELPRARKKIDEGIDRAVALGAKVVGLGALTAPTTRGGKTVAHRTDVAITNGNAFTAAMTFEAILRLLPLCKSNSPLLAIVGATGSVGSCVSRLLAKHQAAERLLLVARTPGRLEALATELRSTAPGLDVSVASDMRAVQRAHLVVLLTSAAEALLHSEHLRPSAIVLDDTQPRNTDPTLAATRPDVTIVDGGLVSVPGMRLTTSIDLPHGHVYACLAETMLLALEGGREHFGIGDPTVEQAEAMQALALKHREHGFGLAPLRTFGRRIGADVALPHARRCVA
jgi:fatty aldehyde-generating acyl-ACP reductase